MDTIEVVPHGFLEFGLVFGLQELRQRHCDAVSRESNVPHRFTFGHRLSDKRFFMAVCGASSPAAASSTRSAVGSAVGSATKASMSSDPITDGVAIRDSVPSSLFPVFSASSASIS